MDDFMIVANGLDNGSDIEGDDIRCENIAEKDVSDEEIEAEDLERRMWKDRIKLKRIKEKQKILAQQAAEKQKAKQTSDQARRKKMSRAQDGILKYMLKLMEVCKARGFVYGIIPEKGKPDKMTAKESSIWLAVLGREESLILQSSGDNGGSGITETPSGGGLDKNQPSDSYDSDYDVDGVEHGQASVSSKDHEAPPRVNDKKQTRTGNKRKREPLKPPQQQVTSYDHEPRDEVPDINQIGGSLTDFPVQESIQEDHTLTDVRPLLVETGNDVHIPANDMLLYPPVQETDYRPSGVHHGPQSSELHHMVPYHFYTPSVEGQQPVNVFQNENPSAIPVEGLQNLEKDGFHNRHERPVDNHFDSSINILWSVNFEEVLQQLTV
ncbi:hypothetical protein L1987_81931 [Smallanthus sonchifolius]|uniref:Uncharacterized protein n=1 Tax=Smallanthus sonchifolius TaxID=185202 RepID=A0ACB8YRY3_9ASTR|nr:hypothetical protein L1987_81931 [Smallanthus sonchifolius]